MAEKETGDGKGQISGPTNTEYAALWMKETNETAIIKNNTFGSSLLIHLGNSRQMSRLVTPSMMSWTLYNVHTYTYNITVGQHHNLKIHSVTMNESLFEQSIRSNY